jgi:hypothetical protein
VRFWRGGEGRGVTAAYDLMRHPWILGHARWVVGCAVLLLAQREGNGEGSQSGSGVFVLSALGLWCKTYSNECKLWLWLWWWH